MVRRPRGVAALRRLALLLPALVLLARRFLVAWPAAAWCSLAPRRPGASLRGGCAHARRSDAVARNAVAADNTINGRASSNRSYSSLSAPKPAKLERVKTEVKLDWNPLNERVDGLPRFDAIRPEHLMSGVMLAIDQFGVDLERYQVSLAVAYTRPWRFTWEKFARPLELMLDRVDSVWGTVGLLRDVNGTDIEVHNAHHRLTFMLIEVSMIFAQSEDFYMACQLLKLDKRLSEEQRRIVDWYQRESWHGGVGLQTAKVAMRFNKGQQELAYLAALFAANVAADEDETSWLLERPEDVSGLPPALRAVALAAAIREGHSGTPEAGPWLLTLQPSSYEAAMKHCTRRALREEMYLAHAGRGWRERQRPKGSKGFESGSVTTKAELKPKKGDNAWIVDRMLELRQEWAGDVGYANFADLAFASRMASISQVEALLSRLWNVSLPVARSETSELAAFARARGETEKLMPWDLPFWRARLWEQQTGWAEDDFRPYLEIDAVLAGVFGLVKRLFGIIIRKADIDQPSWAGAQYFHIYDDPSSAPVAGFFFDAVSASSQRGERGERPHFWAEPGLGYSKHLGTQGVPRRPVAYVLGEAALGNPGALAAPGKVPVFLSLAETQQLFGAFGCALQELLSEPEEGLAAGTRILELDAAGFVPRFFELWATEPRTLRSFAKHYESAEALPEVAIEAAAASERFFPGTRLLSEVQQAQLDIDLHLRYKPGGLETPLDVASIAEARASVGTPRTAVEDGRSLCAFIDIFSGGQAAGRYAGLWASVLAADAFEAFEEAGLDDDAAVRRLGFSLRAEVLAPGGGRRPLDAFKALLGRSPRVQPLLQRLGLAPAS